MGRLKNAFIRLVDSLYYKLHTDEEVPPLNEQLKEIISNFDFERVTTFMSWDKSRRLYDNDGNHIGEEQWKVYNPKTHSFSVPTELELRDSALKMLEEVIKLYEPDNLDRQVVWIGSGPYKAVCRYGILELMCVIEYWSYD